MKLGLFVLLGALAACSPAATAEADYTARLMRCVDKAETLAESKSCRAGVDTKLGVNQKKDGGS